MYQIVLFKNNKKRKKIKQFIRKNIAINFYEKLIKESQSIEFDKKYENGSDCNFDLAIISNEYSDEKIFYVDEFGRNKIIDPKIDESNYIVKISSYKLEEELFDVSKDTKITFSEFKSLLKKDGVYMVSQLKNKFILQHDEDFSLFSLKNQSECDRFLDVLYMSDVNKKLIIVKDSSSPQRKYLYNLLEEKGFSKKFLYTSYTTYPK